MSQTLLQNPVPYSVPYVEFPWSLISPEQGKICSRLSDDLPKLDFSSKSLKTWIVHFTDLFSRKFVVDRMAKISVVYNSCSNPLQQQLLSMNIGSKADKEEFLYQELLQVICVLTNAPNHQELALQQLYAGIKQANADSVTVFLEKIRSISEDAYGLASTWAMNQTSTVIQKVVGGLRSKDLAQLTSSVVISLPFNYNNFRDVICQFESWLPSPLLQYMPSEHSNVSSVEERILRRSVRLYPVLSVQERTKPACAKFLKTNYTAQDVRCQTIQRRGIEICLVGVLQELKLGERLASSPAITQGLHSLMVQYHSRIEVKIFLSIVNSLSIPERLCPPESPFQRNSIFKGWGGTSEG